MERELGVSPLELAQTHRLLLAKCLLTDTRLPVTRVAFASGFQSLRRFNSVFRQRYRMSPSVLRQRPRRAALDSAPATPAGDWVRLTLGYRPPLAWDGLLATIAGDTPPGVGLVDGSRYARTVALDGCRGIVVVSPAARGDHLNVDLSVSLLPALMPLLARLRHLLDLDAEPAVIDRHLADSGLALLVKRRPGLRLAGAFDGFEVAARILLGCDLLGRVTNALGEPLDTAVAGLDRLALRADRVAAGGSPLLSQLGVPHRVAEALVALASAVAQSKLRLEPGADVSSTLHTLEQIPGVNARTAAAIAMRALHWPDAFPSTDRSLQRAAGATTARELLRIAERWRPWRGYAAAHLLQVSRS
jgi:AraC family transcriptional regulator of adaptative response / DNA-3-methyladenine glycosylase II